MFGQRGLSAEASFKGHGPAYYGEEGSVRIDVLDELANLAYDYKFTVDPTVEVSAAQSAKILAEGPLGVTVAPAVHP